MLQTLTLFGGKITEKMFIVYKSFTEEIFAIRFIICNLISSIDSDFEKQFIWIRYLQDKKIEWEFFKEVNILYTYFWKLPWTGQNLMMESK